MIGDAYDNVVIMFSDIVGFSTMSSSMSAVEVFLMLTNLYYAFDRLVDKYGVYKVETIGDGYMIAAGQFSFPDASAVDLPLMHGNQLRVSQQSLCHHIIHLDCTKAKG